MRREYAFCTKAVEISCALFGSRGVLNSLGDLSGSRAIVEEVPDVEERRLGRRRMRRVSGGVGASPNGTS